jgi:hypothetical protein
MSTVPAFKVAKSMSEVYNLQIDSYKCEWATITISDSGDFNAITDCGNFNYSWRGYGSGTFKEFLIRIFSKAGGRSYVYEKLSDSSRDYVDCEKTVKPMRKEFLKTYRELYRDKRNNARYIKTYETERAFRELQDNARETWDVLQEMEDEGTVSQDRFLSTLWHDGRVHDEFFDGDYIACCIDLKMTGDMQTIAFCEVVAPVFVQVLKQEIQFIEEDQKNE